MKLLEYEEYWEIAPVNEAIRTLRVPPHLKTWDAVAAYRDEHFPTSKIRQQVYTTWEEE